MPYSLIEIIKIRVLQINKRAFYIHYHTQEALKRGELPRRIFALSAWKERPLFNDSEKSALQMAEEITHISVDRVADQTYTKTVAAMGLFRKSKPFGLHFLKSGGTFFLG